MDEMMQAMPEIDFEKIGKLAMIWLFIKWIIL